eukprot:SAG31_NODE_20102_length_583_cov_6.161157_2_plen_135_part_00
MFYLRTLLSSRLWNCTHPACIGCGHLDNVHMMNRALGHDAIIGNPDRTLNSKPVQLGRCIKHLKSRPGTMDCWLGWMNTHLCLKINLPNPELNLSSKFTSQYGRLDLDPLSFSEYNSISQQTYRICRSRKLLKI